MNPGTEPPPGWGRKGHWKHHGEGGKHHHGEGHGEGGRHGHHKMMKHFYGM